MTSDLPAARGPPARRRRSRPTRRRGRARRRPPRPRSRAATASAGTTTTARSSVTVHLGERAHAADAGDRRRPPGARRRGRRVKPPVDEVPQEPVPEAARRCARRPTTATDRGCSSRCTDRASARCSRAAVTARLAAVGSMSKDTAMTSSSRRWRQLVARLAEGGEHAGVGRQHLGDEPGDAPLAGRGREVLEQDRAEALALDVVADDERHLGAAVAERVEAAHADDRRRDRGR